ncbi:hypothetical protein [Anaplasma capra]|uniref:hypothetical protein n=1 Tax=Anaplasma capra TaxID=1562740 RepID=UPI0021D5BB1B|nr:hypothetical protein [Anaplasma capra]
MDTADRTFVVSDEGVCFMFDEKLAGGDSSRRDLARLVGGTAGLNEGVSLLLRLPLSLALLATTLLLTTVTYVAVTLSMVITLPIRFLGGFFSKRGWQMFSGDAEGDKEPVNGVQNFSVSLLKVIPTVVLWPILAIFTSIPTLLLSTLAYIWSVCKSVVGFLYCAFTFSDPVRALQSEGRPEYFDYADTSGLRASADLASGFFDENGPHVGVSHPWSEVKSAFVGDDLDILKSMVGGGAMVGMFGGMASAGGMGGGTTGRGAGSSGGLADIAARLFGVRPDAGAGLVGAAARLFGSDGAGLAGFAASAAAKMFSGRRGSDAGSGADGARGITKVKDATAFVIGKEGMGPLGLGTTLDDAEVLLIGKGTRVTPAAADGGDVRDATSGAASPVAEEGHGGGSRRGSSSGGAGIGI